MGTDSGKHIPLTGHNLKHTISKMFDKLLSYQSGYKRNELAEFVCISVREDKNRLAEAKQGD